MIPSHLTSDCSVAHCTACLEPVKQGPGGWYITIGHAGFNSPANNRTGYKTRAAAIAAHRKYAGK